MRQILQKELQESHSICIVPGQFSAHIHTIIRYHMGSMASHAFTQQAQNYLVQNLANVQMDIFTFLHLRESLLKKKCFDKHF